MVKSEYKQTEIGMIPEDWDIKNAESFGEIITGSTPSTENSSFWNGDIPWITPSDIKETRDIAKSDRMITKQGLSATRELPPFTLLVTCIASIGKNAVLTQKGSCNQQINAIIPSNEYSVNYLYYLMETNKEYLLANSGITATRIVSKNDFAKLMFAVPATKREQECIAEALSDVDSIISMLEKLVAKQKFIKRGAMQELLTGKKRLPGFSGTWKNYVFSELFDFVPNNAFTRAQMSDSGKVKNIHYGDILTKYGAYVDGSNDSIPYISKKVDLSRFADRCYLQSGDIIIADTAEDETVGKALEVINVNCPILAGQHTLMCRPKIKFADKFLGYYLNAACYHDQLLPYIVGTKVSSVSKASVAQTKLVVPEYEEQQAIAEILSNMDAEIEALEQKLEKYRQVKQGMMQQLLTGKIRRV